MADQELLDKFCQWLRVNKMLVCYAFEDEFLDPKTLSLKKYKTWKPSGKSDHMLVRQFLDEMGAIQAEKDIIGTDGEILRVEFQET